MRVLDQLDTELQEQFRAQAKSWICDGYFADIRYWVSNTEPFALWAATVFLNPLNPGDADSFSVDFGLGTVGRILLTDVSQDDLALIIAGLASGSLPEGVGAPRASLSRPLSFESDSHDSGLWFRQLHLAVRSAENISVPPQALIDLEHSLRTCPVPFDGVADVCSWFGFRNRPESSFSPRIDVYVGPPVDLDLQSSESALSDGKLKLTLHAHPNLDANLVVFGVRLVPTDASSGRIQVADRIRWGGVADERRVGSLEVEAGDAASVLSMLSVGGVTVRRHWFVDKKKSPNARFVSSSFFDRELRRVRHAIFESDQSDKFEKGIASLANMLGFAVEMPLESDAPDLIVHAPSGRILLVECTLKVTDAIAKAGKLADRRIVLEEFLRSRKDFRQVVSVLVTRQTEMNPGIDRDAIRGRGVALVGRERLEQLLFRIESYPDPDQLLNEMTGLD